MKKEFSFSVSQYLIHVWYKYILSWAIASVTISLLMAANGTVSQSYVLACSSFFFVVAVLLFVNRVNAWKKSKVRIDGERIEFFRVVYDGYEASIELGKRRRTRRYVVVRPTAVTCHGKAVTVQGDVVCDERKLVHGTHKQKEYFLQSFSIPPYFSNWNSILEQLRVYGRG